MSLPYGCEATLGGTVNLGNYESLRFELRGSVRDQAELEALVAAFGTTLGTLGRGDTQTAAAVDSYVRRVIGAGPAPEPGTPPANTSTPAPAPAAPAAPTTKAPHVPSSPSAPAAAPPKAAAKPAAKHVIGGEYVCEVCGTQITGSELTTSKLFASRTLCKPCLDGYTPPGAEEDPVAKAVAQGVKIS